MITKIELWNNPLFNINAPDQAPRYMASIEVGKLKFIQSGDTELGAIIPLLEIATSKKLSTPALAET